MASICELCNPSRYTDPEWMRLHREIESYAVDKHVFMHANGGHVYRKGWEWTQCAWALEKLGALDPGASALAVGAGREPLIFYFADRLSRVSALDLYGNGEWTNEANSDVTRRPEAWCPRSARFDRIRFIHGNATRLDFPDGEFDFIWSLSSIEHFGGHRAAAQAMKEMARVTRPGGLIALATEYLLLPEHQHPEYFNRETFRTSILDAATWLELVSPIDWSLPPVEYLIDSITVPHGVDRLRRHVVLNDGSVQWTSIFLVWRKT